MEKSAATAIAPSGDETYSSAMADAKNYMAWLIEAFGPYIAAPVLEVGVGHGSYAEMLRGLGPYVGVDYDRRSVEAARQRFPDLAFHEADITADAFLETFNGRQFRSVVCLNVLEHVPNDSQAVANLGKALAPGGHLLIIVPALNALYNDLDRLAGHLRRYRREEVRALMEAAGLEVVRADYFNPVGGLGWWANRLKRHGSLNDTAVNSQITLFDRVFVPVSKAMDPATRKIFGQSVIAIGKRP